jgi:hypothetical protein
MSIDYTAGPEGLSFVNRLSTFIKICPLVRLSILLESLSFSSRTIPSL